ncbi:BMP and activin membrane-bound inhibitor [Araneus ventricosus]|uniref:BMP and activin membrane-bound inhibitor n=1 Tax=Araneus ventricosus TaxID=182803 RepID=A0A4Y2CP27_ARAVE|nr:BMP and activin membrane-bound inhibitor [Araneus ventricosus]
MDIRPWELWSVIIVFILSSVKGEIRCYCNQAHCVSTGYMCKSRSVCFSDLDSGLHGCLDKRKCLGLQCCKEDMCNYIHVDMHMHTHKAPMADAFGDGSPDGSDRIALMESAFRREIWFRAAVIATPIAGFCILTLLVIAAARMLRQDAERQRRLLELRRVYGHSLKDTLLPWSKDKNTTIV